MNRLTVISAHPRRGCRASGVRERGPLQFRLRPLWSASGPSSGGPAERRSRAYGLSGPIPPRPGRLDDARRARALLRDPVYDLDRLVKRNRRQPARKVPLRRLQLPTSFPVESVPCWLPSGACLSVLSRLKALHF
jgi:hypothetical protein